MPKKIICCSTVYDTHVLIDQFRCFYITVLQDLNEVPLEGEINIPGLKTDDEEFSTLDEPVRETIVKYPFSNNYI